MSDNLERAIKTALVSTEFKPKPILMRTESIENTIRKSLFEQGGQGTRSGDPMAHLKAAAGKTIPDINKFSKSALKAPPVANAENPAYNSKSFGLEPSGDFATMNAELGINISIAKPWSNSAAYNYLISLGGRPFIATEKGEGELKVRPFYRKDVEVYIKNNPTKFGEILRGVQIAMYNHPNVNYGSFVYFYEKPNNRMYFAYQLTYAGGGSQYLTWEYEPPRNTTTDDGAPVTIGGKLWLTRGGKREGFLGKAGTGAVIFIKQNDPGLTNIAKSDYIQTLRNVTNIDTLFKSNKPTIISIGGREWNLTALADKIQAGFDWVGILIPPIDIINAAWYLGRGRYFEACISIIALIPGLGDAVAIIFRSAWNITGKSSRITLNFIQELIRLAKQINLPDRVLVTTFDKCKQFIQTARNMGIIKSNTYDEMLQFLDEGRDMLQSFLSKQVAQKRLTLDKNLQKKLGKRLGLSVTDPNVEKKTKALEQLWKALTKPSSRFVAGVSADWLLGTGGLVTLLTSGAKTAYTWAMKRSINYWKAAYTMALKQFRIVLEQPTRLTLCIYSFTSLSTRERFSKKALDLLIKTLGDPIRIDGVMKYSIKYVTETGMKGSFNLTRAELENTANTQLIKIINALKQNAPDSYNILLDDVVRESAKLGESVNGYWTAFWIDPVRRFVNENFKMARISSLRSPGKGYLSGSTLQNSLSDIGSSITQFFTTNDFLKRIDIVYNELQEYFERRDYGEKSDIDPDTGKKTISGADFNEQSVLYIIANEAWYSLMNKTILESLDEAQNIVNDALPSIQQQEKVYGEGLADGTIDSLNFQGVVADEPGAAEIKISWMKKLAEEQPPIAKYLGEQGSIAKWKILRTSKINAVKEGEIISINFKTGIMTAETP